jgi:hypothetical protein
MDAPANPLKLPAGSRLDGHRVGGDRIAELLEAPYMVTFNATRVETIKIIILETRESETARRSRNQG